MEKCQLPNYPPRVEDVITTTQRKCQAERSEIQELLFRPSPGNRTRKERNIKRGIHMDLLQNRAR